jgi:hypothetical protein
VVIGRLSFILLSAAGAITIAVSVAAGLMFAFDLAAVVFFAVVRFLAVLFLAWASAALVITPRQSTSARHFIIIVFIAFILFCRFNII